MNITSYRDVVYLLKHGWQLRYYTDHNGKTTTNIGDADWNEDYPVPNKIMRQLFKKYKVRERTYGEETGWYIVKGI